MVDARGCVVDVPAHAVAHWSRVSDDPVHPDDLASSPLSLPDADGDGQPEQLVYAPYACGVTGNCPLLVYLSAALERQHPFYFIKVGLDIKADMRRLGIMQDALSVASKHPVLTIDSNEYWSPKQAVRYIRQMEEKFDLAWVEEPARRWDYRGLRKVSGSP